ncbi:hypothetical protein XELAEV_18016692mg [Xenopus laevis]|uniref:Uncharacterized protein n=1 Tax=Xenopus laevis TaxID=8355 RepID=A0A974D9T3_XENLA|nr:hypothetical protein XELAEV_18016692mg [Xenopus laevis]
MINARCFTSLTFFMKSNKSLNSLVHFALVYYKETLKRCIYFYQLEWRLIKGPLICYSRAGGCGKTIYKAVVHKSVSFCLRGLFPFKLTVSLM